MIMQGSETELFYCSGAILGIFRLSSNCIFDAGPIFGEIYSTIGRWLTRQWAAVMMLRIWCTAVSCCSSALTIQ